MHKFLGLMFFIQLSVLIKINYGFLVLHKVLCGFAIFNVLQSLSPPRPSILNNLKEIKREGWDNNELLHFPLCPPNNFLLPPPMGVY